MHNYNSFEHTVIATLRIDFVNARQRAYNKAGSSCKHRRFDTERWLV